MTTMSEKYKTLSGPQKTAEGLTDEAMTDAMKLAAESAKRARLAQNKLSQEETSCIYRKIF